MSNKTTTPSTLAPITDVDIACALAVLYSAVSERPGDDDRLYIAIDGLRDDFLHINDIEPLLNAADRKLISIGVYVEGGLVQWARSSAPVDLFIVDADDLHECRDSSAMKHGEPFVGCDPDESADDREQHQERRDDYVRLQALSVAAL